MSRSINTATNYPNGKATAKYTAPPKPKDEVLVDEKPVVTNSPKVVTEVSLVKTLATCKTEAGPNTNFVEVRSTVSHSEPDMPDDAKHHVIYFDYAVVGKSTVVAKESCVRADHETTENQKPN